MAIKRSRSKKYKSVPKTVIRKGKRVRTHVLVLKKSAKRKKR